VGLITVGCDKVPLTAPSSSTVTVSSSALVVPTGGTAQITAMVIESGGTTVQNGTSVRFTTTLGRMDPADAQTRNGIATATFYAGDVSGVANIQATSGGIGGTTSATGGTGTTTTWTNAVQISVGAAAVGAVHVRSSAGSVPATGGTVDIVANVIAADGRALGGIPVSFSTTAGRLSSTSGATDGAGDARTSLTTDANATVTATAGTKQGTVAIQALTPVPTPTMTLAGSGGTATSKGQLWTFTATVSNNTAVGSPVKFEWNFGDGVTLETGGPSVTHAYTTELTIYTVTVKATFANGSTVSAVTDIITADFP